MPSDPEDFLEDVGTAEASTEVSQAGFSMEGGKSTRIWQTPSGEDAYNVDDMVAAISLILGSTQFGPATSTGKLSRQLPLADPFFAWLYASSIPQIKGYGSYSKIEADDMLEAPPFPNVALWDQYRITVESLPRPFAVLPDYSINTYTGAWFPETGAAGAGTSEETYPVAEEQFRFCTWDLIPQNDYITQQKGFVEFNSTDVANAKAFQGMPRGYLPNSIYTITWYYVPVRLIVSSNSYITRWRGRVNQNVFYGPDGLIFDPGELLYLSFSQKMFTPPVQNTAIIGPSGGHVVSTEKFCHITFTFLATKRTIQAGPVTTPTNKNYVVGGHNLQPWSDLLFRYAQTVNPKPPAPQFIFPGQVPSFLSFPAELLFTDCDSPGAI